MALGVRAAQLGRRRELLVYLTVTGVLVEGCNVSVSRRGGAAIALSGRDLQVRDSRVRGDEASTSEQPLVQLARVGGVEDREPVDGLGVVHRERPGDGAAPVVSDQHRGFGAAWRPRMP